MQLVPNMVTIVTRMSTSLPASRSTSALFGATRRAILALLFSHSSETYYLRQIARVTGLGLGGVQRELKNLTAAGILRRTIRGNQVCFQANAKNPVFADLKSLITKTVGVGGVLHSALAPLASGSESPLFSARSREATTELKAMWTFSSWEAQVSAK